MCGDLPRYFDIGALGRSTAVADGRRAAGYGRRGAPGRDADGRLDEDNRHVRGAARARALVRQLTRPSALA